MRTIQVTLMTRLDQSVRIAHHRGDGDGSPVVVVAGETEERGPSDVFYIRSDSETDEILLDAAAEAGFNVISG